MVLQLGFLGLANSMIESVDLSPGAWPLMMEPKPMKPGSSRDQSGRPGDQILSFWPASLA